MNIKTLALGILIFINSTILAQSPKRQMRAAWVATVSGIDFPKNKADSEEQKKEIITLLDSMKICNINCVYFQIRPSADAFYISEMEPWSIYLTGKQGEAPSPLYDPLEFMITEAHKRCMELHAWINPYRVTNGEKEDKLCDSHIFREKPNMFVKYGDKYYFNPGLQETRDYLTSVVMDIVLRYDIDGVHMDDYFYPYRIKGVEFPDVETYKENHRGITDRKVWRRDNVNLVVEQLHDAIKNAKPWIEFGVSPFGIYRNDSDDYRGSATTTTCTNFDELSADVLLWLEKGWIDYVAPQLYWEIGSTGTDFDMLCRWWEKYTYGQNLYIGLYASALSLKTTGNWIIDNELTRQMDIALTLPDVKGFAFYSAKYLTNNARGLRDSLQYNYFAYPAIPPVMPKLEKLGPSGAPKGIKLETENGHNVLRWPRIEKKPGFNPSYYVVYLFKTGETPDFENVSKILTMTNKEEVDMTVFDLPKGSYSIYVTTINRFRKESKPSKEVRYENK